MNKNKRITHIFILIFFISTVCLIETMKWSKDVKVETTLLGCGERTTAFSSDPVYFCQYAGGGYDKVVDVSKIEYDYRSKQTGKKFDVVTRHPNFDGFVWNLAFVLLGMIGTMIGYCKAGEELDEYPD